MGKGRIKIRKSGRLEVLIRNNNQRQRLGIASNISSFSSSESKNLLTQLDNKDQVAWLNNLNPTIEGLINTFLVFYTFADRRPDGSLKEVSTDVVIDKDAMDFLDAMFKHYSQKLPKIKAEFKKFPKVESYGGNGNALITFSGGKDSTYMALETKAMPVHIAKINKATQTRELRAIISLSKHLPKNPLVVPLFNSMTLGHGSSRYELRDALIYALMLPVAYKHGAKKIYTGAYEESIWYSSTPKAINELNGLFAAKGLNLKVKQIGHLTEEGLIKAFIKKYPEIFKLTVPCVATDIRHDQYRNWFKAHFPKFPLHDGTCGMCGKDIQLNMARLLHDPEVLAMPYKVRKEVADYCIKRCDNEGVQDFIEKPLLKKIKKEYGS